MVDGGATVIHNDKLVDAAELADQCCTEVWLDPAYQILGACQLTLCTLGFCDYNRKQS